MSVNTTNSPNNIEPEERFSKNAIVMAQAVHESIKRLYEAGYQTVQPELVALVVTVISSFDKHYLIQGFIENSHTECWDKIKGRDEIFFVNNSNNIFKYLPVEKVNLFKDLFLTKDAQGLSVVSQSLKDQIWQLFDAMIKISIKYIHKGRGPFSDITSDGQVFNAYTMEFFEEVDLPHHASVWGVKLEYPSGC